jgi:Spy/CpxP family protein refolding chaperone
MKTRTFIVTTAVICASIVFTFASPGQARQMLHGKWWYSPQMNRELDLTKKDKHAFDNLYAQSRETRITLKGNLDKERFRLKDMLVKEDVPSDRIIAQNKVVNESRAKLSQERIRYILGIKKILGPDRFHQMMIRIHETGKYRGCMTYGWDRRMQNS